MERKDPKGTTVVDELAIVKSAAWAWYERGSGSEGRPFHEFNLTRSCRIPRPSRYKLEVMEERNRSTGKDTNSLLDKYEIERISEQLDYYMESSTGGGGGEQYYGGSSSDYRRTVSKPKTSDTTSRKKGKKFKGFWTRPGAVCGSKNDVVESRRSILWWSDKRPTVVKVVKLRPSGHG